MKTISYQLLVILFIFASGYTFAQKDTSIAEQIRSKLSDADLKKLSEAEKNQKAGDDLMAAASKYYEEMNSMLNKSKSKKKRKQKKAKKKAKKVEKKALKKQIAAYENYQKANKIKYEIYAKNYEAIKANSEVASQQEGEELELEAESHFTQAQDKRTMAKKEKDIAKKYRILSDAHELELLAIEEQEIAYDVYLNWSDNEDDVVIATTEDNLNETATREYDDLANNSGNYEDDFDGNNEFDTGDPALNNGAERKELENADEMRAQKGLVFRIQVIATSKQLTPAKLRKVYSKTGSEIFNVEEAEFNGRIIYRYLYGTFDTYSEAHDFKKTMNIKDSFVVAYKDGVRISILDALQGTNY